jgi:uncharacterized HAD superfamily protein
MASPYRPLIAVDIDEVLARFAHTLASYHNEKYSTSLTEESFFSYQFHEVWGGTVEEANSKVRLFHDMYYFFVNL